MAESNSIANNDNGTNTRVYFRFEGKLGTEIETVDVSLSREDLTAFPESLLSRLADDAWKSEGNPTAGQHADNPLITKPMEECQNEWHNSLAQFIVDTYEWKHHQQKQHPTQETADESTVSPTLSLPHGIELEEAMVVMDYYGIALDDPSNISLDKLDDHGVIQGKLFLKELANMEKAKSFIVDVIKQNPKRENWFVFAKNTHDIKGINGRIKFTQGWGELIRVGDLCDCTSHYEWVQNSRLREVFITLLREETNLTAEFQEESKDNWEYNSNFVGHNAGCNVSQLAYLKVTVPSNKRIRLNDVIPALGSNI